MQTVNCNWHLGQWRSTGKRSTGGLVPNRSSTRARTRTLIFRPLFLWSCGEPVAADAPTSCQGTKEDGGTKDIVFNKTYKDIQKEVNNCSGKLCIETCCRVTIPRTKGGEQLLRETLLQKSFETRCRVTIPRTQDCGEHKKTSNASTNELFWILRQKKGEFWIRHTKGEEMKMEKKICKRRTRATKTKRGKPQNLGLHLHQTQTKNR